MLTTTYPRTWDIAMDISNLLALDATQIVALHHPTLFFTKRPTKEEFSLAMKKLRSRWYDRTGVHPEWAEAFKHIKKISHIGEAMLDFNTWNDSYVTVKTFDSNKPGVSYQVRVMAERDLQGFGLRYEGPTMSHVEYPPAMADLGLLWRYQYEHGLAGILKSPSDARSKGLSEEFKHQWSAAPTIRTLESGNLLASVKRPGYMNVRDIYSKLGPISVDHVTWMLSRLYNLACFMEVMGVVNLSLSLDGTYVNPATHQVLLLDGWQYYDRAKSKLMAAPERTLQLVPELKTLGTSETMLRLIKAFGREALGDINGASLLRNKDVPRALTNWLMGPSGDKAIPEYRKWAELRDRIRERKFIKWEIEDKDVYGSA